MQRLRLLRHPLRDVLRIEVQRHRVDLREDGRRADPRDRLCRRIEREGRADHLVARTDPERVEHEHDRVGAVGDADRLRDAERLGRLALEPLDLGAEDETPALEGSLEGRFQLWHQGRVLRLDVNVGNRHCSAHGSGAAAPDQQVAGEADDRARRPRTRRSGSRGRTACQLEPSAQPAPANDGAQDRAADRRQHGVAAEADLEDAGGNRDERAHDRRHAAERAPRVLPPRRTTARRARCCAGAEVEAAAVPLEQRAAAVDADRTSRRARRAS